MVWKPACLLRFGEVGVKTPTLFVCVCVHVFFYAKQNEMGTGDIDSRSIHKFKKTLRASGVEVVHVVVSGCKGEQGNTCSVNQS